MRPRLHAILAMSSALSLLAMPSGGAEVRAPLLRLSKVAPQASPTTERIKLEREGHSQSLHIEKHAIVTEADVQSADRSAMDPKALSVTLTPEGGKKLFEATQAGDPQLRIAILIRGELISAPMVMAPLGRHFVVDGLGDDLDLDLISAQLMGKNDEQIAQWLREQRAKQASDPPPQRPKPEHYSDEEYAALKQQRKQIGLFYVDAIPDEEELAERIQAGMTEDEVVKLYGKPNLMRHHEQGHLSSMQFMIAPERRAETTGMRAEGFQVNFKDGRVVSASINMWTDAEREGKPPARPPGALDMKLPAGGLQREDFGSAAWLEQIELFLKEGHQQALAADYGMLASLVFSFTSGAAEDERIAANCSVIQTLAQGVPEIAALRAKAGDGEILFRELGEQLRPYIFGDRPFAAGDEANKDQ